MEKKVGIWINTQKAIIVTLFGENGEKITEIDSDIETRMYHNKEGNKGSFSGIYHNNLETKFDNRKKDQIKNYLDDVIENIKGADYLYIFGPAEAKLKLEQKLHDEKSLGKTNLKAVETSDSMTLNQVVAQVKEFYNPLQRKVNMSKML